MMRPELRKYLFYALLVAGLVIVQITLIPLISVLDAYPSLPLIGVAFISMREGAAPAMLFGFFSGLMIDAYAGEVVGISALALTISGFAMGFYYDPEKTALLIRSSKAVGIVFFGAALYCIVYVFAYFRSLDFDLLTILFRHVVVAALYTTVVSTIPVLILARTGSRLKV